MTRDRYFLRDLLFGIFVFFIAPVIVPAIADWIFG